MTRPHITRTDGQIHLTYTAPMITVILTDEQARELMAELQAVLQTDLPTSQIDLPTSHPEIPHLPGWTRVVDALPDMNRYVDLQYRSGSTGVNALAADLNWPGDSYYWNGFQKTHWRYTEAP